MTTEASEPPDPADPDADPESVARAIALRMLERQPRTRLELERAMARRDVPSDVAAAILDRFTEVGLVDDSAFAQAWVDSRHRGRGLARRALSAELRRRGVEETVLQEAVAAVSDDDEQAAARALVERKLRTMSALPREVQMRRLVAMLGRKGFGGQTAITVVRAALSAES
ncbi:MAG TPA: regulatory protein RecX [Mycobacteriales bacterium]|jgi:regulatory protein|nr:regulatory protein RecX [Mycobacteriales bacterium]